MKKLSLSGFDIGAIVAAVVIALLGAAGWWFLSGALQDAQAEVKTAKSDYDRYSSKSNIVVSPTNGKILQGNIDLLKAQLDPLIQSKLLPKENKLSSIDKEDPVAWKQELDDQVHKLNADAKAHGVTVPPNFYFGFSRYLNQSPGDEQTAVLSKQLLGIEQISTILINATVKDIKAVRRTYEEDPHTAAATNSYGATGDPDHISGFAMTATANAYTDYPFEVEFETTSENLRPIINNLIQSPYLFVVRTLTIENNDLTSPLTTGLDQLAGTSAPPVIDSSPGEVAANTSTKGPQKFFGYTTLKIKARIDMIEWTAKDIAKDK